MKCSVVGVTGYTGMELAKLLLGHPYVTIESLTTRQEAPGPVRKFIPELPKSSRLTLEQFNFDKVVRNSDVIFLALPHTTAAVLGGKMLKRKKIVIDLSADFRLKQTSQYKSWYGFTHPSPQWVKKAVYGLPECYREKLRNADLIANPGCYPTGALLALKPLVVHRLIDLSRLVIDAKSGVSGAGRKLTADTQFCEADENFSAYKVNRHQHMPEIEQELSQWAGRSMKITFVPHLLPVQRGILTAVYAVKRKGVSKSQIINAFERDYAGEPFVRFFGEGKFPSLRDVRGTNFCDIGVLIDGKTGQVIVISAIDNLIKGASGQAVQNMNIRAGFPEEAGLTVCR